jgi:UDP-N-acetylmuramate dehydrogenase
MMDESDIPSNLPKTKGRLRANADLSKLNWFQVGGVAEYLFRPEDVEDLANFIAHKPTYMPTTILGAGSNLLIRDGGIEGIVVRLGKGFAGCHAEGDRLIVGAGCFNSTAVLTARDHGIGGLEFLSGIPGSLGGALFMNAGAYGSETKDILVEAEVMDAQGSLHILTPEKLQYSYRHCGLPEDWIFIRGTLQGKKEDFGLIAQRIDAIATERSESQPVRTRTGGSTFKNPPHAKAWQLIDAAGCRGFKIGDAQMSEKHCNFMINTGNATAQDMEMLGEEVRAKVHGHSGIMLEWEIKRIGKQIAQEAERAVA